MFERNFFKFSILMLSIVSFLFLLNYAFAQNTTTELVGIKTLIMQWIT